MPVDLDPQLAALINQKVETGNYPDSDAVVREALQLLEERDRRRQALRAALDIGFEQLDRGEGVEWTPESMERLIREADELDQPGQKPDPDVCP